MITCPVEFTASVCFTAAEVEISLHALDLDERSPFFGMTTDVPHHFRTMP
jgi:hypothetical protein